MDFITLQFLATADIVRLKNSSKVAQGLEDRWQRKVAQYLEQVTQRAVIALEQTGHFQGPDLESLFIEHYFDVSIAAMRFAESERELETKVSHRLASLPRKPGSLEDLMRLYDLWRRKKYTPKEQVLQANRVKKDYLKKVSSVWEKHSESFRKGDAFTQQDVIAEVQKEAGTVTSRAQTIVRTETTNYYNTARKALYDQDEDVTHYLLVAVRDAGTSPWCTPLTINGFRGRSGLVYAKADPLCAEECPACHPGCRSEFLPLNRLNPAHLRYIQDEKLQRRNHKCFPLLKGWRS